VRSISPPEEAVSEKLRSADYRLIAACILVCAASLLVGIRYFYRAFPEASIDFRFNKDSSRQLAGQFLADQDLATAGYRHAASFQYDDEAKVFLERELGLEQANALIGDRVKLWRWGHRWYKPLQREELRVEITTTGKLGSFLHVVPEDAPGADLPSEAARSLAESFLVLETGRATDTLEYLDSQAQKRPYRTDHVFTWKVPDLELRGATYRISVTVQGDRVDGYNEYLRIPEEWSRSYARLRSLNEGATQVDLLFFALLGVAMLVTLGRRLRRRDVAWRTAMGFAAVACVLQFFASLNEFPLAEYGFDTASSYGSFIGRMLLVAGLSALSSGGFIFLLTAASEPLYRETYRSHISITRMFGWSAIRTRSFFVASIVGVTLTFFFFAYEIGFYLLAKRFGAWSPADIPYTDLLNTRLPWVFVLLGGFFPAVSEEWAFRAFSIPYLGRLLRSRWFAVLAASLIWGFGHANYPNQPFFIRGVEVGLVGIILSWAMIRFGILAPLIAHYSIDAFYSAFLLLRSGNTYLVSTGAVTAGINLIPLMIAAGAYLATRHFRAEAPVSNEAEGTAPPIPPGPSAEELPRVPTYQPLTRHRSLIAFGLLALGCLLLVFRAPRFGDFVQFRISMSQAVRTAKQFLSRQDLQLDEFRAASQPVLRMDPLAVQYIYTAGGIAALNRVYGEQVQPVAWQARFYQPLQKEEFRVNVNPADGKVSSFRRSLPEDAPGAEITESQARAVATSFLQGHGLDLSRFDVKESKSEKLKQRRDSEFTWEAKSGSPGAIGEARVRIEAAVLGDKIGGWAQYIRVPEQWRRMRERQGLYSIAAVSIRGLFMTLMFAAAGIVLVRATRQGVVQWSLAAKVALAAMILELVNRANSIPEYFYEYDTQVSVQISLLSATIGAAVLVMGIGLVALLSAGLIMACYPDSPVLLRRAGRAVWNRDAVIASIGTLGMIMVLQWTATRLQYHMSRLALAPDLTIPENVGTYIPIVSNVRDILLMALLFTTVLAFGVYVWTRLVDRPWMRGLLLVLLLGSFLPPEARRVSEGALGIIPSVLLITFICVLVVAFYRTNYLAYVFSAAFLAVARTSSSLLGQGNIILEIQGWTLWVLVMGVMVVIVLRAPRTG
jgi:membrane protease YdiL (CAAX protease family)